jgi:hypothetical protein
MVNNAFTIDFSPINNALAGYQKQRNSERDFAENQRQFDAQNYLAKERLGIARQAAGREAEAAPLKMDLLRAQIEAARRSGATEAQLAPLKVEMMRAQKGLYEAQAHAARQKDELNGAIAGMLKSALPTQPGEAPPPAPSPGAPTYQPQSFSGGPPPVNYLSPNAPPPGPQGAAGGDPLLIPTQAGGPAAPPMPAQPQGGSMVNTPVGPMTIERARQMGFALGLAGKGDAGKMFVDAANADRMEKTARNEVEKDLVGLTGTIGRLESIERRFDPKFLNIPQRAGMAWAGLQDKFGSLPEDQKADLARYTKFRQTSVQNAALYVKYLSGVAVSEPEFARIMKTLPNAGTGIFDGDSPTEFQAKMKESVTQAKMAYARAMYLRSRGFAGKPWEAGIALDDMGDIIRQRGAELQQQLQGRVAPDRMRSTVRQRLKQEFGI